MLHMALVFLVVGLIAALLGFTTIAGASIAIAKFLAGLFFLLFLVFLIIGWPRPPDPQLTRSGTETTSVPTASPTPSPAFALATPRELPPARSALRRDRSARQALSPVQ